MADSGDTEWYIVEKPSAAAVPTAAAAGDGGAAVQRRLSSGDPSARSYHAVLSKLPRRFKGAWAFAWLAWRKRSFILRAPVLTWTDVSPPDASGGGGAKRGGGGGDDGAATAATSTARATAKFGGSIIDGEFVLCPDTVVQQRKEFSLRVVSVQSPVSGTLHLLADTPKEATRWFELLSAAVPVRRRASLAGRRISGGSSSGGGGSNRQEQSEPSPPEPAAVAVATVNCGLCGEPVDEQHDACDLCGSPIQRTGGGVVSAAAAAPADQHDAGDAADERALPMPVIVARQLSEKSVAKVELAFNKLDHNADGAIRTKDIGQLILGLALAPEILELLTALKVHEFLVRACVHAGVIVLLPACARACVRAEDEYNCSPGIIATLLALTCISLKRLFHQTSQHDAQTSPPPLWSGCR